MEADHIEGLPIAKNEVNGSFNVAVLEVVPTNVIAKGILGPIEAAIVERGHISRNPEGSTLFPIDAGWRNGCCILPIRKSQQLHILVTEIPIWTRQLWHSQKLQGVEGEQLERLKGLGFEKSRGEDDWYKE